jgi:hypothetical protein
MSIIQKGVSRASYPRQFAADTGASTTGITVGTSVIPLISIRPKATFNGVINRGVVLPSHFECLSKDQPIILRVIYNGTLTGSSFTSADSNSIAEYDTSATSITGGENISTGYVSSGGANRGSTVHSIDTQFPLTLDADGNNPKTVTLVAAVLNATQSEVWASWEWTEIG